MDALTDSIPSFTSYAYCLNNPVKLVEPDGNIPVETVLDIGFLVYDIGAAVVNHIQGNHAAAVDHWVNAGADVVAVATPYAPATATRAVAQGIKQGVKQGAKVGTKKVSETGQRNITRTFSSRKRAIDARPKPSPIKAGQKRVTNQTRNKKGEGNKFKTDGRSQTLHLHDKNHTNKSKRNVHYRIKTNE